MVGGKGIIGIVFWCSGLLMMALPRMMGICGPYMDSVLLMSYMVIGQFLILFFKRLLLVSVLMSILRVVGVLLICLLILFHVSVNMPCCSLLGSEKCNQ